MFRTLIYPSSGAFDYSVELSQRSYRSASACNTDTTPTQPHRNSNTHWTKNNTTNVVVQQNSRKFLMMDILMSETCWAHKKWNKITSDIKLVFYSSTIFPLFKKNVNFKVAIIEMYLRPPRELVVDPKGFTEHALRTTALKHWSLLLFTSDLYESFFINTLESGLWHTLLFVFRKLLHLVVLGYWPNLCINFIHLCFAACYSFASAVALSSYRFGDVYKLYISVSM